MGSFYKLDSRQRITQVMDATSVATTIDSTTWPDDDSTSTQHTAFIIRAQSYDVPHVDFWDSTGHHHRQLGARFQCPAGKAAYITSVSAAYYVPNDSSNEHPFGDSTTWISMAQVRFYVTDMPLDTTASVWAPTPWQRDISGSYASPFAQRLWELTLPSPLGRPLHGGETLDLRFLPLDGPRNYCSVYFEGYVEDVS